MYDAYYDSDCDELEYIFVATVTDNHNVRKLESVNVRVHFGNIETKVLRDGVCTIIQTKLEKAVLMDDKNSYWVKPLVMHDFETFLNDIIKMLVALSLR